MQVQTTLPVRYQTPFRAQNLPRKYANSIDTANQFFGINLGADSLLPENKEPSTARYLVGVAFTVAFYYGMFKWGEYRGQANCGKRGR